MGSDNSPFSSASPKKGHCCTASRLALILISVVFSALIIFGIIVEFKFVGRDGSSGLSAFRLQYTGGGQNKVLSDPKSPDHMHKVKFFNAFAEPISIFFEDGEAGTFLEDLEAGESAELFALVGQEIYATKLNDFNKIASKLIKLNINSYVLGEHGYLSPPFTRDNVKVTFKHNLSTEPNPYVEYLPTRVSGMAAKFRSMSPRKLVMWYDDHRDGILEGHLKLGQETTTNTYPGHVFYFTVDVGDGRKGPEVSRFRITEDKVLYVIYDEGHHPPPELSDQNAREEAFMKEYENKTGLQWRHYYGKDGPRPPPTLFMWPAGKIGVIHRVESTSGYWTCQGTANDCQSGNKVTLDLEVVSLEPRVFIIRNFISEFEANQIIEAAKPRIHRSSVGDGEAGILTSDTRTSLNTWVPRKSSVVTESLFLRAADLLQIDEKLLHQAKTAEDMQVVHYSPGQKYDAHHDWGVSGYPESRFITLLIYLNDMEDKDAGGHTSFPKAKDKAFRVHPGKGSAVLFYNLLEDGNGDDLALHAAEPVVKGEKWLANFWVWDPVMKHGHL